MRLRREIFVCLLLVLLALPLRLYRVTNPIADWHSFRQADTASVTREYLKNGVNLLVPRYHDLSDIQSGKDNPMGYRMVEFPLLNAGTAAIITLFQLQDKEALVGRIVSILLSLFTLVIIYTLGSRISGKLTGFFAALLFALLPYAAYYSRVILPEPALLSATVGSLLALDIWAEKKHGKVQSILLLFVVGVLYSAAVLIKPFAVFYLPAFLGILLLRKGMRGVFAVPAYIALSVSGMLLLLWRSWIQRYPQGIPASGWLLNESGIRFTGAYFHWIYEVRIATLILGIGLVAPFVLGIMKRGRDALFYLLCGVGMFAYVTIVAGGNVRHDYYQVLLLPFLVLTAGRGMATIWRLSPRAFYPLIARGALGALIVFSLFVSWYQIRGYYNVNHWEIVEAGTAADRLLPKDAKVIAPYMGDTAFLYQTKRIGWPIGFGIEDKISKGAQYYITVNFDDEANALMKKYRVVEKTEKYLILNLNETL